MKDTFTLMPTFVASDGNTILVRKDRVLKFFQEDIEYKHLLLTEEEKQEEFLMNHLYADIIHMVYKQPLQDYVRSHGAEVKLFRPPNVSHETDYERMLLAGPGPGETEEVFQLRLERLKNHIEWSKDNT